MATGKPIVSTAVKDVVTQYTGLVDLVKTPEEFVEAAQNAMQKPDKDRIQRCLAKAQQSSWESTVSTMQGLIREAIKKPDRPSNRKIEPLPDLGSGKTYEYLATQGS
jgi:hypothetical protein